MVDIIKAFNDIDNNLSLDEKLYAIYNKFSSAQNFEIFKKQILSMLGIDEYEYYTKGVNKKLVQYVEKNIFPEYEKNDQGHGILHIKEVIRRSFALNDTFKLHLDANMIYAIAACHDLGKYIDHKTHHLIAADIFYKNEKFKEFFTDKQRLTIKEAIEDHRSSKEDEPRTILIEQKKLIVNNLKI